MSGLRRTTRSCTDISGGGGIAATVMAAEGMWSGAAGKADGVHAVQLDSQFGIGSVTKSVVAAQVMQLVEAGELSLDDPATDHLPADFAFDTNGAAIRQLLDMRSGIPDWYGEAMEAEVANNRTRVWKQSDVLALVDPARRPAGGASEYADTNYDLLGLVIEHVRRRPLVEVLREGVLRVEGTERLIYQPDEIPTDPMAMPLGESRDALEEGGGYLPSLSDASSAGPAGSIASDSISLARWWRAFCAGEIVSEASLTEMSTFVGGPDGYGLGSSTSLIRGARHRAHRRELRVLVVGRVHARDHSRRRRRPDEFLGRRPRWAAQTAGDGRAFGLTRPALIRMPAGSSRCVRKRTYEPEGPGPRA